ncbi:MAG: hypothetical protein KatS3mg012_1203 [Gaiellaceae bacterium]|jgi:hypothetical protein|nr:MAG: hypothetical protein KatS3mg012_1203 [Gaiellaceae bacterium]
MVSVHEWLGAAVIAVCVASAAVGLLAARRGHAGPVVSNLLVLAQTVLVAQAAAGLLLLSDGHRAPDRLHYAYGAIALGVVLAPWFYAPPEARRRLVWFSGAAFLAGALATRAYLTGS